MGLGRKIATAMWWAQAFTVANRLPVSRLRLALIYLRLKARARFRGNGAGHAAFLGRRVESADMGALPHLFLEVFAMQEYGFTPRGERPFILDVGGNIGVATLFFKMISPGAEVHVFEPSPNSFALLEKNIAANRLERVTAHHAAASNQNGTLRLYMDEKCPTSVRASVHSDRGGGGAGVEVPAVRLSELIDREVDFLKMDIEGAEMIVLNELAASGKLRNIREMAVEYHHHVKAGDDRMSELLRLLESNGFGYQIRAIARTIDEHDQFQDVMVRAYRK